MVTKILNKLNTKKKKRSLYVSTCKQFSGFLTGEITTVVLNFKDTMKAVSVPSVTLLTNVLRVNAEKFDINQSLIHTIF
jgi:hypothetical protein